MGAWLVQCGAENVTVWDEKREVRFRGTIESALTHFAFVMDELDRMKAGAEIMREEIATLTKRIDERR